ncbi:gfo/Idh/MocA family oxidoreductase [Pseudodesulfovibrio cashew]|uniref:Gfo/Idh/MocA family oxidoreductase n=1 Tax=Pseudodesulfovibrio cashew TaxID=2678688 RepID=A0A6I6JE53_9BACT|nr:Gfo/Idh/MocA family oxidoreductase [Pseudodesulfovibrio cashew]QGY39350.1 gfo/Idh/MocA family oxidoreductase [Pseudodesulfovibrio cashew]
MIQIAQLGCGYWGPNLLRNLDANGDCNVKYVCDMNKSRRDYVATNFPGTTPVADPETVYADPEVDAIVIATPVAFHYEHAIRALEAGKHILVEKPMARTAQEVEAINGLAREKGLVAMAGHTFLYNAAVLYLKELIDSGQLGNILYISSQRLNLGRIRQDVDAWWNLAPHDISIIQYLLDDPEPESVTRVGMDFKQPGIDDVAFVSITYPGNVMANIHVSWLDPEKVRKMTVVGSRKMAVYDDMSPNKITILDKGIDRIENGEMDFDDTNFFSFNHRSGDILMPKIDFQEPLKTEIGHFLDCVAGRTACHTDGEHALRVVKILEMASE